MMDNSLRNLLSLLIALGLTGCAGLSAPPPPSPPTETAPEPTAAEARSPRPGPEY
jgi:hypothetical protein